MRNGRVIGFTAGTFDMFHIGHLNLLRNAKKMCDYLIVGVNSDDLVQEYKGKKVIVPWAERKAIVEAIRYVDEVIEITSLDKKISWFAKHYDMLFIGDDWKGNPRWERTAEEMKLYGVETVFLPHTIGTTSTLLREKLLFYPKEDFAMVVDKEYCMSSYLTFRYVYKTNVLFRGGIVHKDHKLIQNEAKVPCASAVDIDREIKKQLAQVDLSKAAVMLSGGMDSAILASYMPPGTKAYTAVCVGDGAVDETKRAKEYCDLYNLEHIVVEVSWDDYENTMDELMRHDGTPIIPNEPQAYKLAKIAKADGAEIFIYGDCADTEFGGMDRLLSKDWTFNDWIKRYQFVDPERVLVNPVSMEEAFNDYRVGENGIDFVRFIGEPYALSAAGALTNAFECAGINYMDPYEHLKMAEPLDLQRVRNGESKYLIRELFKMRYPALSVPEKLPMSRPAEAWMKNWQGPVRKEFIPGCVKDLTGEQKLLVYSLERFLNLIE